MRSRFNCENMLLCTGSKPQFHVFVNNYGYNFIFMGLVLQEITGVVSYLVIL
jgi:hypothetical protein